MVAPMSKGMFSKVLIANRGEIACRVIRTCRRLGIRTVAVYSEADRTAQHVRLADEAWPIGGPRPQESYLRGDAIIEVAQAVRRAGDPSRLRLPVGERRLRRRRRGRRPRVHRPERASMRKMGSKAGAKELMAAHGVPVVPGYTGADQDPALLQREADQIGYPLMIKAAHGGGGKGMRIVHASGEFAAALESCQREAAGAFGATACCSSATSASRATSRSRSSPTRTATPSTSASASARRSAATRR
jgi:3-methylcrotonyl-CoA carboxylase alpha subunit